MTDKIIVFSTCGSAEEAGRIARALVEKKVAACVNILTGMRSVYRWKGAVEDAEESLLVIKTTRDLFGRVRDEIRALHSYEVPEVIALPVVDGLDAYLSWIGDSVGEQLQS
jgi:periplasmic divalent cation tolerance protein